jgi:signal transduction histidine kinase
VEGHIKTVNTPDFINDSLLDSIVEQLRSPLLTIQLMVEAGQTENLNIITRSSIQLLDDINYVRELARNRPSLDLAPVNVAALSEDVAHVLSPLAATKNIIIQTKAASSRPVLAHRFTLLRAYENMVRGILNASPGQNASTVLLTANNQSHSVRFGAYSSTANILASDLNQMRKIFGLSRRPLSGLTTSPATELYIADTLLSLLGLQMRTAISSRQHGFATILDPSSQLSLLT